MPVAFLPAEGSYCMKDTTDKIIDITRKAAEKTGDTTGARQSNPKINDESYTAQKTPSCQDKHAQKATNPIIKKLAKFKNDNLSKKFDITDLFS